MRVGTIAYSTEQVGVYAIRNILNNKVYIGSSAVSLPRRILQHKRALRRGDHKNNHLQSAWNKYGEKSFRFEILVVCCKEECLTNEQKFITKYKSFNRLFGYNRRPTAENQLGLKHKEETKSKLSDISKSYWKNLSKEEMEKARKVRKGRKLSAEARAKIASAGTGRKHTEATLQKMRESQVSQRERKTSEEFRDKLRIAWIRRKSKEPSEKERLGHKKTGEALKGKKRPDEVILKISLAQKGREVPEEKRARISATLTGRKLSDAHKEAIRIGLKKKREIE